MRCTQCHARLCPKCGSSEVTSSPTCNTWRGSYGWMTCSPSCGDATDWDCEACGWSYTEGLNPQNPRAAANEANRPDWLGVPA